MNTQHYSVQKHETIGISWNVLLQVNNSLTARSVSRVLKDGAKSSNSKTKKIHTGEADYYNGNHNNQVFLENLPQNVIDLKIFVSGPHRVRQQIRWS